MTVTLPPVAVADDGDDPFMVALDEWFDQLFTVAITDGPTWPIVEGLIRDLRRRARRTEDIQVAIIALAGTAGEIIRDNHPGPGHIHLRLDQLDPATHPGWVHGARAIAAAAAGDDITPFLDVDVDPQFAIRMLASIIGITITQAHTWLNRPKNTP